MYAGISGSLARRKGIHIVGTGDFTHPAWREELAEKLEPAEDGLYVLKKEYRIKDSEVPGGMIPPLCHHRRDQFNL